MSNKIIHLIYKMPIGFFLLWSLYLAYHVLFTGKTVGGTPLNHMLLSGITIICPIIVMLKVFSGEFKRPEVAKYFLVTLVIITFLFFVPDLANFIVTL